MLAPPHHLSGECTLESTRGLAYGGWVGLTFVEASLLSTFHPRLEHALMTIGRVPILHAGRHEHGISQACTVFLTPLISMQGFFRGRHHAYVIFPTFLSRLVTIAVSCFLFGEVVGSSWVRTEVFFSSSSGHGFDLNGIRGLVSRFRSPRFNKTGGTFPFFRVSIEGKGRCRPSLPGFHPSFRWDRSDPFFSHPIVPRVCGVGFHWKGPMQTPVRLCRLLFLVVRFWVGLVTSLSILCLSYCRGW